jgi:hypothetical protein
MRTAPRLIFRPVLLAGAVVVAGCGSPTAPEGTGPLPFKPAAYVIDFSGDTLACGDLKNPQAGTAVSVRLNMQTTSGRFIATSAPGAFRVQFEREPAANAVTLRLTGTATGFADDEGFAGGTIGIPPNGPRMTVDPGVPLIGEIPSPTVSDFALGRLNGPVVFSRGGVSSTCPAGTVSWTLNRVP